MTALLNVILPVFILIAAGYLSARLKIFTDGALDGLMQFSQSFAIPILLFLSILKIDLRQAYDIGMMLSFYIAALCSFVLGFFGARIFFHRPLTDSVAIGFACLFSNSLLLGIPMTERAYGASALVGNFAIVSLHSLLLYSISIVLMELARAQGRSLSFTKISKQVSHALMTQPLVIGIIVGFAVNVSGLSIPGFFLESAEFMARAAIPCALFGLGGILCRYRPEGDKITIAMVCAISLIVHPSLTYLLGTQVFDIGTDSLRSAVMTSAMAPGLNAYLFALFYGVALRVNASSVLVATVLSIGTIWVWLQILP